MLLQYLEDDIDIFIEKATILNSFLYKFIALVCKTAVLNWSENVMNSFAPWVKCEERHSRHEDALSTPDGKCECLLESFIITGYLFVH